MGERRFLSEIAERGTSLTKNGWSFFLKIGWDWIVLVEKGVKVCLKKVGSRSLLSKNG